MVKISKAFKKVFFFAACLAVVISVPIISYCRNDITIGEQDTVVITLWQIDSFEGGKGSRSTYIQSYADKYFKNSGCYVKVVSMSSEAARLNIESGLSPDLISYGAGMTGIEKIICGYTTWCYGGYCYLALNGNGDFTDISAENTVINGGVENFIGAAAILSGLKGATVEKPTEAYVNLINGKYKYLLGTQRDIYRLKTRGVAFAVKPVTQFNDLYQNISIVTDDITKKNRAEQFIEYLLKNNDTSSIGLMSLDNKIYEDEMGIMEELNYDYELTSPISVTTKNEIISAIKNSDENMLKNILK